MKLVRGDPKTKRFSVMGVLARYRILIHKYDAEMTGHLRRLRRREITEDKYNKVKDKYDKKRNRIYTNIRAKYIPYFIEQEFRDRYPLFVQMFREEIKTVAKRGMLNGFIFRGLCGFEYSSRENYLYIEVQFSYFVDYTKADCNFMTYSDSRKQEIGDRLAEEIIPKIKDRIRDYIAELLSSDFGRGGFMLAAYVVQGVNFLEDGRWDRKGVVGMEPVDLTVVGNEHDWILYDVLISHSPTQSPRKYIDTTLRHYIGFFP